eukprot:SAG11_NODE_2271_length_3592_cov_2.874320_3_plen_33_part_01
MLIKLVARTSVVQKQSVEQKWRSSSFVFIPFEG